ncbi:hypothetical protein HID58_046434 [Brassica napus]|uniref:Uncharacterized protein n=1 Tax=Brassica napus TaxID=3708 RepID=A0ABQ8AWG7_BRANA|nr:hypothetical protein HID58_046434 [Brassica napus]
MASFVEEAHPAINEAHFEAESSENGIGFVKRLCVVTVSSFYLEGEGELLEFIEIRIKGNGHMVIVRSCDNMWIILQR